LHSNIKFVVDLDGQIWHHVKRSNCPTSQLFKNKWEIILYHHKLWIFV